MFDTDDYEELDSVAWVNYLFVGGKQYTPDASCKYKEYAVQRIRKQDVKMYVDASSSDDVDCVQDDFIDKDFKFFGEKSGLKWHSKRQMFENILGGGNSVTNSYFETITNCMIPDNGRPATEQDFDKAIRLVHKYGVIRNALAAAGCQSSSMGAF